MSAVLIDAYNFLHFLEAHEVLPSDLEQKRHFLVQLLAEYRRTKEISVTLVFDGQERGRDREQGIEIFYSDYPQSADDLIEELCEQHPGRFIVVSNDNRVRSAARRFRHIDCDCESFYRKIKQGPKRPTPFVSGSAFGDEHDFILEKETSDPIYRQSSTKKRGNPRKPSKADRQRNRKLKKI